MDRKKFLKKGMAGLGSIAAIPAFVTSCNKEDVKINDPTACVTSAEATAGPFGIKTPTDLVRENIIGNRAGVPLLIKIKVENINDDCQPIVGVHVDVWHCDARGNYSEYTGQIDGNFTADHFLRGRQTTGDDGQVSFLSIYPGWYPGRATHLHVEVLRASGESLLTSQIAFPEDISRAVYESEDYRGDFDTSNANDGLFVRNLESYLATAVVGNTTDGYTLAEILKVPG